MNLIDCKEKLDHFRDQNSGEAILDRLAVDHHLLISLPVGVGKSFNMDSVISAAILGNRYDLVIVLVPTRQLINERKWIREPDENVLIANLKPRPQGQCGELNKQWRDFEKRNLGMLAREELCSGCVHHDHCDWLHQYGESLRGTQVLYATQTHWINNPSIVTLFKEWCDQPRVLILVDEANFLMSTSRISIEQQQVEQLKQVLQELVETHSSTLLDDWLRFLNVFSVARSDDLRCYEWRLPVLFPSQIALIQKMGVKSFGNDFSYIGNELQQFCQSPLMSRERTSDLVVSFAPIMVFEDDSVVYSGTTSLDLLKYRLEQGYVDPYPDYVFQDKDTTWYNISSNIGTRKHFESNAPQILDFYTALIVKRMAEGKRILLIAKKCFITLCAVELQKRLLAAGVNDAEIITESPGTADLSNAKSIPLINYGVIGTNHFEGFHCCYCLTGYYVNETVVNYTLQQMYASDYQKPIKIEMKGSPRRRRAGVANEMDRYYDINLMAQNALDYHEMGVVIQAVGRVRPFTKAREIITMQCADPPKHISYSQDFDNLQQARDYFGLEAGQAARKQLQLTQIQDLKKLGLTQQTIANHLHISSRTVQRYWSI
jgi:hypothetical protein